MNILDRITDELIEQASSNVMKNHENGSEITNKLSESKLMQSYIKQSMIRILTSGPTPVLGSLFQVGLEIGYELAQIEKLQELVER